MAVLKIAHLGHPILRQVAEPVSPEAIRSPEIQRLIQDMLETMTDADGAGLAAPQVHVSKRVVIYGVEENPRYPDKGTDAETPYRSSHVMRHVEFS